MLSPKIAAPISAEQGQKNEHGKTNERIKKNKNLKNSFFRNALYL